MSHMDILQETVKTQNLHFKTCHFSKWHETYTTYWPIFGDCLEEGKLIREKNIITNLSLELCFKRYDVLTSVILKKRKRKVCKLVFVFN